MMMTAAAMTVMVVVMLVLLVIMLVMTVGCLSLVVMAFFRMVVFMSSTGTQ